MNTALQEAGIEGVDLVGIANVFRDEFSKLENDARTFTDKVKEADGILNKWEVIAQSIIAMRHIEDARMRYWKVIQYMWNWVSKYDK